MQPIKLQEGVLVTTIPKCGLTNCQGSVNAEIPRIHSRIPLVSRIGTGGPSSSLFMRVRPEGSTRDSLASYDRFNGTRFILVQTPEMGESPTSSLHPRRVALLI